MGFGNGAVMVGYDFDAHRVRTYVPVAVPHGKTGVIGPKTVSQYPVDVAVSRDGVIGVTAAAGQPATTDFALAERSQGASQARLGGMHNDVPGYFARTQFEALVQFVLVVDDVGSKLETLWRPF